MSIEDVAMRKRLFYLVGIVLLITFVSGIWLQHAADADELARLRRYSPYGHHFIDTALTGGKVKWSSKEIMIWKVRRRTREFQSVDEFKAEFLKQAVHKKATIAVHHPALNLNLEEGRESYERAEEILAFLVDGDYENAGPTSD